MQNELDGFDRHILSILQEDATRSSAEIADAVGLSQSPCWRRIQRLRDEGYITRQVALLDRRKVGFSVEVFAMVKLSMQGRQAVEAFATRVRAMGEVLECHVVMGDYDFLLRIVAPDAEAYQTFFFERLSRLPGVQDVTSIMTLSDVKSTTALPL